MPVALRNRAPCFEAEVMPPPEPAVDAVPLILNVPPEVALTKMPRSPPVDVILWKTKSETFVWMLTPAWPARVAEEVTSLNVPVPESAPPFQSMARPAVAVTLPKVNEPLEVPMLTPMPLEPAKFMSLPEWL